MMKMLMTACAAAAIGGCATQLPEARLAPFAYDADLLALKSMFNNQQAASVGEPFVGVRPKAGIESGHFPIKATGVSTEPMRVAAEKLLASLGPQQVLRTQFGIDDSEWRRWFNIDNGLFVRQGVSLKEMTQQQRDAAFGLMHASLSARGFAMTEAIRKTDQTLHELNGDAAWLDEELYYFTIMGVPSPGQPWGWQIDGHHLVINYFVLGDQVVMTPTFMGAEPAVATTGKYAGNAVLQQEQDAGLGLMRSLDKSQRAFATLDSRKATNNIQAEANMDNLALDYAGVPVSTFSQAQKDKLLALIALYVGNMDDGHARIRMDEIEALIDRTWFAWVGDVSDGAVFYYRIHSPILLIEFDHQLPVGTSMINDPNTPTRAHVHTIVRTPNGNDYGKDLLAQHLADHRH